MEAQHFQYMSRVGPPQLFQGDVLERTEELQDILKNLYPYAHQTPEKYPYFVVLTQSCDLIEDQGRQRKAEHITLAAARPIHLFLEHEISKLQTPILRELGVCLTRDKNALLNKIERLLSNEEYPFFYLHPSDQTPFTEALVTYLRVTFPLRTDLHYVACLNAKKVQLAPEFRAKLGWLTTLVFGRVATEDFKPDKRKEYARQYIDGINDIEWRRAKALANEAKQKGMGTNLLQLTADQLKELIDSVDEKSHLEVMTDLIVSHARDIWPDDETRLTKLRSSLLGDHNFKDIISD